MANSLVEVSTPIIATPIRSIRWDYAADVALAVTADGNLLFCDLDTGGHSIKVLNVADNNTERPTGAGISPDLMKYAVTSHDGFVRLYDSKDSKLENLFSSPEIIELPHRVAFINSSLLSISFPHKVTIWRLGGFADCEILSKEAKNVVCPEPLPMSLSADGAYLVFVTPDGAIEVWDTHSSVCLRKIEHPSKNKSKPLEFQEITNTSFRQAKP